MSECEIHGSIEAFTGCPWCQLEAYADKYTKLLDYATCLFYSHVPVTDKTKRDISLDMAREFVLEDLEDWEVVVPGRKIVDRLRRFVHQLAADEGGKDE